MSTAAMRMTAQGTMPSVQLKTLRFIMNVYKAERFITFMR